MRSPVSHARVGSRLVAVLTALAGLAGCASTSKVPDRGTIAAGLTNAGIPTTNLPAPEAWAAPDPAADDEGHARESLS